ncbi:acyl-CoA dehydrogenase family protein [Novosphingobium pokkalii]|uniref:acyl-CoA dehydrogenase family protein n=1 Tax=Novosphingobium pokkalii TaxID=1770194 RepID=UPI0036335D41
MNFELSEEETMLAALADRFVADRYDIERRRTYQAEATGFSSENWALLAECGLMAAPLDEADGGMNLEPGAIVALFSALGRGLVVEPLAESVLVGARLLLAGAGKTSPRSGVKDWRAGRGAWPWPMPSRRSAATRPGSKRAASPHPAAPACRASSIAYRRGWGPMPIWSARAKPMAARLRFISCPPMRQAWRSRRGA